MNKDEFIKNVKDSVIFLISFWLLTLILPVLFSGYSISETFVASSIVTWMFALGIIITATIIETRKSFVNKQFE